MKSGTRSRLVSVVIPVRNGGATIGEQLVALRDQASDCDEIVVVDNGSVDDTRAVVESFRDQIPNLRLVDGEGLVGVSSVRNHAAAHTVGDLLWCDADDVVAPGWVTAMIEGLDEHDIVGGAMEEYSLNGPCAIPRTGHAHGLACAWDFLPYAIGANVAVRREVIEGVGGWNPRYTRSGEDVDLCWRALLAGFRIGFAPDAVVHYRHRSTARTVRVQQVGYARTAAMLHREYRPHGLRRGSIMDAGRVWGKVVLLTPAALVSPRQRLRWNAALGYVWGTVAGGLSERAWPY